MMKPEFKIIRKKEIVVLDTILVTILKITGTAGGVMVIYTAAYAFWKYIKWMFKDV